MASVCLVTGGNSGIGLETARALVEDKGLRVLIGCRNAEKGSAAAEDVGAEFVALDLAEPESISACVRSLPPVDIVICNAGVVLTSYHEAPATGIELTAQVCHFGHAQLVMGILEKQHKKPRVVMVSSESHRLVTQTLDEGFPCNEAQYSMMGQWAYGQAKLANIQFALALRKRGIEATSLHPGSLVNTNIAGDSYIIRALFFVASPFTKSVAQAAETSVHCALCPAEGLALYYKDSQPCEPTEFAKDEEAAERLWKLTEQQCKK